SVPSRTGIASSGRLNPVVPRTPRCVTMPDASCRMVLQDFLRDANFNQINPSTPSCHSCTFKLHLSPTPSLLYLKASNHVC
ncbi:hypothetical protein HAX54_007278, partial [Datura stramonium]|nr:hypothetical protein [Datura stramonium]